MRHTLLHSNPFNLLGVSTRDNRNRIVELAEEKSLVLDNEICAKAKIDLTNPRKRLSAELSWLPGMSPRRAQEQINALQNNIQSIMHLENFPALANANLIAAAFELFNAEVDISERSEWIWYFATIVEEIDPEEVMKEINEDRAISGFPEVHEQDVIENELNDRRHYYKKVIRESLNSLSPLQISKVLALVVDSSTNSGKDHAPLLIDDLIDSYEVDTQSYLQREADNIKKLLEAAHLSANRGEEVLDPLLNRIDSLLHKWKIVVEPIHLSIKARGIEHPMSYDLAREVRKLGIYLFNEHAMLNQAQHLTILLKDIFRDIPELLETLDQDSDTLSNIQETRDKIELLNAIHDVCRKAGEITEKNPLQGADQGQEVLSAAPKLIYFLEQNGATQDLVIKGKDEIALTIMNCAIVYGSKTEEWGTCRELLEGSLNLSVSNEVREKISKNLDIVRKNEKFFKDVIPIDSAPSLSTINGIGFKLYGMTDNDPETRSYLSTYYFTFLFIPIFPICRYRVISEGDRYKFLGKAPLRVFDKWHLAISIGVILFIFLSNSK